jgi:dTDP-4-dehydrorhamnose 3,5-epimerase
MKGSATELPGVLLLETRAFRDARGSFRETWRDARYRDAGVSGPFVQDNVSISRAGVLRGLHFQHPHPQGKLVSVLQGAAFDVAVDVRADSPTFGRWTGRLLSADNGCQLWIPEGFAHGFLALAEDTVLLYKCTSSYHPEAERTVLWDDPVIGIDWPDAAPLLSEKDLRGSSLADVAPEHLPRLQSPVAASGLDRDRTGRLSHVPATGASGRGQSASPGGPAPPSGGV